MATHEKSIDVKVPIGTAYNQWTQFEEFPEFMEGVREVRQVDDTHIHWCAEIAGRDKEWDAEIVEQTPDREISWRSISGAQNNGTVTFQSLDPETTRVTLRMDYQPEGAVESTGDALGFVSRRVDGDLEHFKEFVESRGHETGAWRGQVHQGHVEQGPQMGGLGYPVGEGPNVGGSQDDIQHQGMGGSQGTMYAGSSDRSGTDMSGKGGPRGNRTPEDRAATGQIAGPFMGSDNPNMPSGEPSDRFGLTGQPDIVRDEGDLGGIGGRNVRQRPSGAGRGQMAGSQGDDKPSAAEQSIEVHVPLNVAYDQWTQFEQFPQFMEGVREVRQLDDAHIHWRAEIGGREKEWDAQITEQTPDREIAWQSTSGTPNSGMVSFQSIDPNTTRVTLRLEYEPEGTVETVGDKLGFVSRQVGKDLENFKEFIEARGRPTGAWEGEIHGGQVQSSGPSGSTGYAGSSYGSSGMAEGTGTGGSNIQPGTDARDEDRRGWPIKEQDDIDEK